MWNRKRRDRCRQIICGLVECIFIYVPKCFYPQLVSWSWGRRWFFFLYSSFKSKFRRGAQSKSHTSMLCKLKLILSRKKWRNILKRSDTYHTILPFAFKWWCRSTKSAERYSSQRLKVNPTNIYTNISLNWTGII